MAKQDGPIQITGTVGNITFYRMEEQYYARKKSSLTRKKFMRDAAFAGSRRSCKRLGTGSKLASVVYRSLPEAKRYYALYCELKSFAIRLLKEERSDEDVLQILDRELTRKQKVKRVRAKMVKRTLRPRIFVVFPHTRGKVKRVQRRTIERLLREGREAFAVKLAEWLNV